MWWIQRDFHTGAVIQTYWQNDEPEPKRVTALLVLRSPRSKGGWKNNIWLAKIEGWCSVIPYNRAARGRLLPRQIQGHSESCPRRAQGTQLQCATSLWAVPLPAGIYRGVFGSWCRSRSVNPMPRSSMKSEIMWMKELDNSVSYKERKNPPVQLQSSFTSSRRWCHNLEVTICPPSLLDLLVSLKWPCSLEPRKDP